MAIWIVQWIGREIRVLDYIEGVGQVLAFYVNELRSRGYQKALCYLPHDGGNTNPVSGKNYAGHLEDAGFDVTVVPNQGQGAASDADRGSAPHIADLLVQRGNDRGRARCAWLYHERKDETRNVGPGPDHDWSSHAVDAFGLMAVCYEEPTCQAAAQKDRAPIRRYPLECVMFPCARCARLLEPPRSSSSS
jgi:phage terminase large subunit